MNELKQKKNVSWHVGNAISTSKAVRITFIAMSVLLLMGCGSKEEPYDWDSELPVEDEIVPEGYEQMKVKRGEHDSEKYSSAQHQQFITLELPFLDKIVEEVSEVEEGYIDTLLDYKHKLKMQQDSTYDNRAEMLEVINKYDEFKGKLVEFKDTHPDSPEHVKRVYTELTYVMDDVLTNRVEQLQVLADQTTDKINGEYMSLEIERTIKKIDAARTESKNLISNYKITVNIIKDYYMNELEQQHEQKDLEDRYTSDEDPYAQ